MNWVFFALLAIIFYATFDLSLKLAAGKIHDGLGGFLINLASIFPLLLFIAFEKLKGKEILAQTKPGGIFYSVVAGLLVGGATIFFIKMYSVGGANLSLGSPSVRIGTVILASLLGIFVLKEGITIRYVSGFILALIGLYLLIGK